MIYDFDKNKVNLNLFLWYCWLGDIAKHQRVHESGFFVCSAETAVQYRTHNYSKQQIASLTNRPVPFQMRKFRTSYHWWKNVYNKYLSTISH